MKSKKRNNLDCIYDLEVKVASIETDVKWIKEKLSKLDSRVNQLIIAVIIALLVGIFIKVI